MIIQLIGPPCSGKSTLLKSFKKEYSNWKIFDIVDYKEEPATSNLLAENQILKNICNLYLQNNFIIESACGFNNLNSIVIKLNPSQELIKQNFIKREGTYTDKDKKYLSYLEYNYIEYDEVINIDLYHKPEQVYLSFKNILKYNLYI